MQFIELSGGTYEAPAMMGLKESTRAREAYFLAFAESIRSSMQTPLVVTGGFRSAAAMNDALRRGSLDMVGLARPLALFPDLPHDLLADPGAVCTMPDLHTGIGMLDRLKAFDLVWYERQLHRMGAGGEPRPGEHPLWALLVYLLRAGPRSLRRRRV